MGTDIKKCDTKVVSGFLRDGENSRRYPHKPPPPPTTHHQPKPPPNAPLSPFSSRTAVGPRTRGYGGKNKRIQARTGFR